MTELFWATSPLLESVGKLEPEIVEMRETIRRSIRFSIIPMKAYSNKFLKFLPLNNIDIKKHIALAYLFLI